jgi:repressor LexA
METKIYTDKDKIIKYLDLKGVSKNKFYKETGLSNGFLDSGSSFSLENLRIILDKYRDIDPQWLLTGKGEMIIPNFKDEELRERVDRERSERLSIKVTQDSIPLVNVTAIGGFGNSDFAIEQMDVKDYYVIPKFKHKQIDFMIEVEGSSMYPKYNSGDIVACRIINEKNFIQWNKTHVVGTRDQGIIIKRLKQGKNEKTLLMVSDNDQYDPFEVRREDITGVAIVVGVIRLE